MTAYNTWMTDAMKCTLTVPILLLLLPAFMGVTHAQSPKIDSLKAFATKAPDVRRRIDAMNDLAWELRHIKPDAAMTQARQALILATEQKYDTGQAWAYRNIHVVHHVQGEFQESLEPGYEALKLFERMPHPTGLAAMYNNIGLVHLEMKEWDNAFADFALALKQVAADSFQLANANANLGLVSIETKDWENALLYSRRALDLYRALHDEIGASTIFNNIGWVYEEQHAYDTALAWYNKALTIRERGDDTRRLAGIHQSIGTVLRKLGRFDESLVSLYRALELNNAIGAKKQLEVTYEELALTYAAQGNFEGAFKAHKLFAMMKDSVLNEDKARDIRYNDAKHRIEFEKERNNLLEESKELQKTVAIGASIGFLLLLVFSFFLFSAYKSKIRINEQLRATQNQLVVQEKLASLGQLTAGIAHEIQNPLNFINNFAQVSGELISELEQAGNNAEVKTAILEDLRQSVSKIHVLGTRADGSVRCMMMHARVSSDERQYVDINALLNDAVRLASHGGRATGAHSMPQFDMHLEEGIPVVNVVPQDISRVFVNILNNAVDAVCERSTDDQEYIPAITMRSTVRNRNVEIRIRDNGTGVPDSVRKRMFDPFFTTKESGKGTGLGLSISYDIIVQKHSGSISVESVEGQYTEFIISLPLVQERIES